MTDNDHDFTIDIQNQPMACLRESMLGNRISYFEYATEVMRREELVKKETQRFSDLHKLGGFRDEQELVSERVKEEIHKWIEAQITSMCRVVCSSKTNFELKLATLNVLNNGRLLTAEITMARHNDDLFPEVSPCDFLRILAETYVAYPLSTTADTIKDRYIDATKSTVNHVEPKGLVQAVFNDDKSKLEKQEAVLKTLKKQIGETAYFTYLFHEKLGLSSFETARQLKIKAEAVAVNCKKAIEFVGV